MLKRSFKLQELCETNRCKISLIPHPLKCLFRTNPNSSRLCASIKLSSLLHSLTNEVEETDSFRHEAVYIGKTYLLVCIFLIRNNLSSVETIYSRSLVSLSSESSSFLFTFTSKENQERQDWD